MSLKVLVASDNPKARNILRFCCENQGGVEVDEASDTGDAVRRINTGEYNLAIAVLNLTDARRKVFDARELARQKTSQTSVYLVTLLDQYGPFLGIAGFAGRIDSYETFKAALQNHTA